MLKNIALLTLSLLFILSCTEGKTDMADSLETRMYDAIVSNDVPELERLHETGGDINGKGRGEILLAVAVSQGTDSAVLDYMLRNGVNPEIDSIFGDPYIVLAAYTGKFEVVEKLLDLGASPWVANRFGITLAHAVEEVPLKPYWTAQNANEPARLRIRARLVAAGLPFPPPPKDEVKAQVAEGVWPWRE